MNIRKAINDGKCEVLHDVDFKVNPSERVKIACLVIRNADLLRADNAAVIVIEIATNGMKKETKGIFVPVSVYRRPYEQSVLHLQRDAGKILNFENNC